MFTINIFGKIAVVTRTSIKLVILMILAIFLIIGLVVLFYNPTYAVTLNGEIIGYTSNKSELQTKINEYIEANEDEGVAFVQVDAMPTYELCLLKKNIVTNDDEIYAKVTENGTEYYKYYAITDDKKEKVYVATFKEAEKIVAQLKKKNSANYSDIGIVEKYDTKLKKFTSVEKSVSKLYERKQVTYVQVANYASPTASNYTSGSSYAKVNIGVKLINPTSGIITSRFGNREGIRSSSHKGLDIAAPRGTIIKAAAGGTVTYSGNCGDGFGNYVIVSHGNGVQTLYAHCSQLLVKKGETVTQGQVIAKVGSTGRSTGNHLHFEVRVNGVSYDPQNYTY